MPVDAQIAALLKLTEATIQLGSRDKAVRVAAIRALACATISTAASAAPRTKAGMIMRCRLPRGSSKNGTKPEAGSTWSRTERKRISMIPSQKFGIDTPPSDAPLASMSQSVLRRTAARTPANPLTGVWAAARW